MALDRLRRSGVGAEYVFLGWRTVPSGSRAVMTDLSGNLTYSDGPSSHFLFRQVRILLLCYVTGFIFHARLEVP